jgi:4-amino-4-deoxy-L-arabinose transferase-like glycosyltransferase
MANLQNVDYSGAECDACGGVGRVVVYIPAREATLWRAGAGGGGNSICVGNAHLFSQSEMILLDMPAMTFTALALLLFLDERYAACAAACTVLVLMKETSITTPMVFGAWLLFRERKIRQALYFFAPAVALGAWLILLHHKTGYWLGSAEFTHYNVNESLTFSHIMLGFSARLRCSQPTDAIGTLALILGFPGLREPDDCRTGGGRAGGGGYRVRRACWCVT